MNVGFIRLFLFTAIIVGLSVAVFPFKRNMVFLYIESGEIKQANSVLQELLAENPDDFRILMAGAKLAMYEGDPNTAIAMTQHALNQKPRNQRALHTLARYLEWNIRPLDALAVYEKIVSIDPKDKMALEKIINFSRYFDLPEKEGLALARLLQLQRATKEEPPNVFQQALAPDLETLAKRRLDHGYEPLADMLMQRLYILEWQYRNDLADGPPPELESYVIYALERYLISDFLPEGEGFAARMDKATHAGLKNRLLLATVMRWNGLAKEAVAYLDHLEKSYPDNEQILLALTQAGRDADNLGMVEHAFERLVATRPDNQDYATTLSNVYMENEKYGKAFSLLAKLVNFGQNIVGLLKQMVTVALFSGDQEILQSAARETERFDLDDPDLLLQRAEVYAALDEPKKAFPLYIRLTKKEPKLEYAELALNAAVASASTEMVQEAATVGQGIAPQNADFMELVAEAYLGVDRSDLAYGEFKAIAMVRKTQDAVLRMLEIAGFSGNEELVADATDKAHALFPNSATVASMSGEMYLWLEKPDKAYPYFLLAAELSKGNKERVDRMIEVASFAGDNKLFQNAVSAAVRLRPDDITLRRTAAQLMLAQGNSQEATAALQDYLKKNPNDDEARKQLAYLLLWTGKGGDGQSQMAFLSKSRMKDPEFLKEWAQYTESAGLDDQAFRLYERLFQLYPANREYRSAVIRLAGYTNRPETAARLLAEDSDARPEDFDMALKAGTAWSQANDIPKAVRYLERAHAIRPAHMATLRELAKNYGYNAQPKRMIASYEKAVDNGGVLNAEENLQLARGYVDTTQGAKAIPLLKGILTQTPLPKEQGVLLATAMIQANRFAEGVVLYRQLAQENSSDPTFLAEVGDQILYTGDLSTALQFYDQTLKLQPDNLRALRGSGMIYAETGDSERAIRTFRQYNRLRPDDPDIRFQLGELLYANNRRGQAQKEYKTTLRLLRKQAADGKTEAVN